MIHLSSSFAVRHLMFGRNPVSRSELSAQEAHMANIVITERFPTWAAASAARNRLYQNGGVQRFGIEHANIDRIGSEFALMIHTDEAHRSDIEHLLRSSGTMFDRPLGQRPGSEPGLASPLLIFGIAVVAGGVLY